jgi:hypothetical protein
MSSSFGQRRDLFCRPIIDSSLSRDWFMELVVVIGWKVWVPDADELEPQLEQPSLADRKMVPERKVTEYLKMLY